MNIFVRNVPMDATDKQVTNYFREHLRKCNILLFHASKLKYKPNAIITVDKYENGQLFLFHYGQDSSRHNGNINTAARIRLTWSGKTIYCSQSDKRPTDFALRALTYDGNQAAALVSLRSNPRNAAQLRPGPNNTRFEVHSLKCGVWDYTGGSATRQPSLVYVQHFTHEQRGTICLGRKQAIILLGGAGFHQTRVDINYRDCNNITIDSSEDPSISFDLQFPPKIYTIAPEDVDDVTEKLQNTHIGYGRHAPQIATKKKVRRTRIDTQPEDVVSTCFVYRIRLADATVLSKVYGLLNTIRHCSILRVQIPSHEPDDSLDRSRLRSHALRLHADLTDTNRYGGRPFPLLYQIERLAKNGKLPAKKVQALLPKIDGLYKTHGLEATLFALRRFYREVPQPGPETEAHEVSIDAVQKLLDDLVESYDVESPDNVFELSKRHEHINLVHKAIVTPTRVFLAGPEPEPTNRVLRGYRDHVHHFLRVVFQDEDGSAIRYDPRADQSVIYNEAFKRILDTQIIIAGQWFSFLGFSHSSLRSQSCWFMAPFVLDLTMIHAPEFLKRLGNFSHIRSPAKCAARIGQNFTDTNATVDVDPRNVRDLAVIERNGRDFSDGVGTISHALLRRVWRVYGSKRLLKPTALQIRFQGFKGMVSLDSRLQGERLMLRSNMKKFETETTWNLEICGAGFRPLPMVLNRQFIKILEDLGVPLSVFKDLQDTAIERLRAMTTSAILTASFLEDVDCPRATGLSGLIRHLNEIGLDYRADPFIYSVVEMAILAKLRDIKYRGRIPVANGVTLYGIMDETGVLRKGEIFVVTEDVMAPDGTASGTGRQVLVQDRVIVTRSPAMHPGDIQLVNAVQVPVDSPLRNLSNVVVFSQHGARDLPSQLSGGDLDGDLYNIIYHRPLIPPHTYRAADYPRLPAIELDRAVNSRDMSDFFVKFMESDQLGSLCNKHMQIADQEPMGTLSPKCVLLAEMASTAVDFSKTGRPVNMKLMPKATDECKPDFMAPNPRVVISSTGHLEVDTDEVLEEREEDEAFEGLDEERRPARYYKSEKILGHLYRAIDEKEFLTNMHRHQSRLLHPTSPPSNNSSTQVPPALPSLPLLSRLLNYLLHWAYQYGVQHAHHLPLARDIRNTYEETLVDIAHIYEPSAHFPLTEAEIFSGAILGRQGGAQGRPLRELGTAMRARFSTVVEYAILRIRVGDQQMQEHSRDLDEMYEMYDDREMEGLPRALACLQVAMVEASTVGTAAGSHKGGMGELRSFRYVAAEVALQELKRWQITTLGRHSLPRV